MWGDRFWPIRYFADRYFGTGAAESPCGLVEPIGDLTKLAQLHLTGETDLTGDLTLVGHNQQITTGAIGPTGELQKTVRLVLGGSVAPTGEVIPTGGTPVEPAAEAGGAGGGRWVPRDPYETPAHTFERFFDGETRPTGDLTVTVIRGKPAQPVPLFPDVVEPPEGPVVVSPSAAAAVYPPIRQLPRRGRPLERPAREATPEPKVLTRTQKVIITRLQPPVAVPPRDDEPPVTPAAVPDAPLTPEAPDVITPTWPPVRGGDPAPIAEAAAVDLEEAAFATTRLPLYTREELMALGRRMRVGFRAPDSARLAPPVPTQSSSPSGGTTGGATGAGVRGRSSTGRPGNHRPRGGPRG